MKGFRDFLPEEQITIEKIIDLFKSTFKRYGFSPLETPALEDYKTLSTKGGAAIGKEVFILTDRAGRKLGLRFDLTVPMARVLAENPNIPLPFKRYQIAKVWRQEFGTRDREFWQCDVDTVGTSSLLADAEMLAIAQDIFKQLNIKVKIKYNSRKLLANKLKELGVSNIIKTIQEIDKLDKGTSKLSPKIIKAIKSMRKDQELKEFSKILSQMKVKAEFDPTLARGLDYYTGIVYEVFAPAYKYSIAGGGRYDNLLKQLGGRNLPATGISFGLSRIYEILKKQDKKTVTQLYIIPIQAQKEALTIAKEFREAGINTDLDLIGRSISKNLSFCNSQKIPYVIFVGQKELKEKKVKLRDMKSGREQLLTIRQAITKLRKYF